MYMTLCAQVKFRGVGIFPFLERYLTPGEYSGGQSNDKCRAKILILPAILKFPPLTRQIAAL